jgi:hypothetical protein
MLRGKMLRAAGKAYVGQAKDLGDRPWTSLLELTTFGSKGTNKATALKDGANYLKSQFLKLEDTSFKSLNEMESHFLKQFGGTIKESGKTYNIRSIPE